jgi:hypothetical protein
MNLPAKLTCLFLLVLVTGCGAIMSSATGGFSRDLSSAVLDSNDPDTIAQALPSYLLTVDALLKDSDSADLYWSAAKLNSSYASQFAMNAQQKQRLADKAWRYAQQAACYDDKSWCDVANMSQTDLEAMVKKMDANQVPTLFNLGSVWASWLEANSGDWNAVAQLGKIQVLMDRVVALDENYELASAHVYLGVLATLIPAALGGKPDVGKEHFERAISLSKGRNLMAKVLYAERYARLMFDRELHDRLLQEVVAADSTEKGWTLANTMAQKKAQQLLDSADDYF